MENRNLTCIGCPLGCQLEVTLDGDKVLSVSGNTCPRGENYAIKEVTNPTRILTSSVLVEGGDLPIVSGKTREDIPKDKIWDCLQVLENVVVNAPISIGDTIVENIADTGVDFVATKNIYIK
jgi:CxxC motif-containing protein